MPTWTGLGADNNWSTAGNWDTGVPTLAQPAIFSGNVLLLHPSNKNVTITASATCANIDFTGYLGTATFTNTLTIRGSGVNLGTTATFSGTGGITINNGATAASFTSNNLFWGMPIIYNQNGTGAGVHTYFNNWTVSNFTTNTVGGNIISAAASGGAVITVTGNLNISQAFTAPTLTFRVTGTSTIVSSPFSSATGNLTAIVQIDSGVNTVTLSTLNFSGSMVWISGPMTVVGTLTLFGSSTLNLPSDAPASILMSNITQNINTVLTLLSDVNCNNFNYGNAGGSTLSLTGGFRMKIRGNFLINSNAVNTTGTGIISMIGTGSMSQSGSTIINNAIETNTLGTITLFSLNFGSTWTHTPTGTILAGSSTITLIGGAVMNTAGLNFFNISIPNTASITINSLLSITNNLTLIGSATFTGTAGWTCANLLCSTTVARIIILQAGITYTTTTNVNLLGADAGRITMRSNTPTVLPRAIWTLNQGATQSIVYVNGQGVDSNAGQTVWTFGGVITTALVPLNWNVGARPAPYGYISFS